MKTKTKIKYVNPRLGLTNSRRGVNFFNSKSYYSQKMAGLIVAEANLIIFGLNKKL